MIYYRLMTEGIHKKFPHWSAADGKQIEICGRKAFIGRFGFMKRKIGVTDAETGGFIAGTRLDEKTTINAAMWMFDSHEPEYIKERLNKAIAKYGRSPLYDNKQKCPVIKWGAKLRRLLGL